MKFLTGAIFFVIAEMAFAHTHMIQFPHYVFASQILLPVSLVSAIFGVLFIVWGLLETLLQNRRDPGSRTKSQGD